MRPSAASIEAENLLREIARQLAEGIETVGTRGVPPMPKKRTDRAILADADRRFPGCTHATIATLKPERFIEGGRMLVTIGNDTNPALAEAFVANNPGRQPAVYTRDAPGGSWKLAAGEEVE